METRILTDYREKKTAYAYLPDTNQWNCEASCNICFLKWIQQNANKDLFIDFMEMRKDLQWEIDIQVVPSDSFWKDYLENYATEQQSAYWIDWQQYARTSWIPLSWKDAQKVLSKWRNVWYKNIIMNAREFFDTSIPDSFNWYVKKPILEKAINNIQKWNKLNEQDEPYNIWLTVTLNSQNYKEEEIRKIIKKSVELWIELRFNSFIDTEWKYSQFELSANMVKEFYKNLSKVIKEVENEGNFPIKLSISQDIWAEWADEISEFISPDKRNTFKQCDAWETLFTVLKWTDDQYSLRACVDTFKWEVGKISKNQVNWKFEVKRSKTEDWNLIKDELRNIINKNPEKNGCIARPDRITKELNDFLNKYTP